MATSVSSVGTIANQDQFLQLLVAQLQNQDPLEPVGDTEFISQIAQFSSLQGITDLNANFASMLELQQLTQGSSLIGKNVKFSDTSGSTQAGSVSQLLVQDGNILLQVGGQQVPLSNVQSVQ